MEESIKLAVIGGGVNSAVGRAHFSALNLDRRFEITTGCFSRNEAQNLASNVMWKAAYLAKDFKDLESMRNQYEAILILTPTPTHFQIIESCIKNDIPIITEKSMTSSYGQGQKIRELTKESSQLFVTFNYTGYPMVRELKKRVERNHYGKIHSVHVEMLQDSFGTLDERGNHKKVQDWRLVDHEIPTVSLDLGVHVINLLEFVVNQTIDKVAGIESHVGLVSHVLDNIHALGTTSAGTSCRLTFGKTYPGKKNGLKISLYGSQGAAHWRQETPNELIESDNKGGLEILNYSSPGIIEASKDRYMRFKVGHPIGFIEAFANIYEDIFQSLKKRESRNGFTFGIDEALSGLATLTAIHESSDSASWVSISNIKENRK